MALVLVCAAVATAADPFVGAWKLNLAKSTFTPGPGPKSLTIRFEATKDGYKSVDDSVGPDGKANHSEDTSIWDGKEHAVTGNPNFDAYSTTKVDAHTANGTRKRGGQVVGNAHIVVSKDGKTLTITAKGKNPQGQDTSATLVLEKQ